MTIKDYKHMIKLQHTHTESKVAIKDDRLNSTHFFIMKIPTKRDFQQIALNHSSDISTKGFINVYKRCTAEPYIFFFFWLMIPRLHWIILYNLEKIFLT